MKGAGSTNVAIGWLQTLTGLFFFGTTGNSALEAFVGRMVEQNAEGCIQPLPKGGPQQLADFCQPISELAVRGEPVHLRLVHSLLDRPHVAKRALVREVWCLAAKGVIQRFGVCGLGVVHSASQSMSRAIKNRISLRVMFTYAARSLASSAAEASAASVDRHTSAARHDLQSIGVKLVGIDRTSGGHSPIMIPIWDPL